MHTNTIPLLISTPRHETAYISREGNLILTYAVVQRRTGAAFKNLDDDYDYEAKLTVRSSFTFEFSPNGESLLKQLIKTARMHFDPVVLSKSWHLVTQPSSDAYITVTIRQEGEQFRFDDPVLEFCRGIHWHESIIHN
jgi:hypothetical protein